MGESQKHPLDTDWSVSDEAIKAAKKLASEMGRTVYVVPRVWRKSPIWWNIILDDWLDHPDRFNVYKNGYVVEYKGGQSVPLPPTADEQAVARVQAFLAAHDAERAHLNRQEVLSSASSPLPERRRGFIDYEMHELTRSDLDVLVALACERLEQ